MCHLSFALLCAALAFHCSSGDEHNGGPRQLGFGADAAEASSQYWTERAQRVVAQHATRDATGGPRARHARNAVLFLGDGMSVPTLTAARTLLGQRSGRPGEEAELSFETFPTSGLAKTYCVDAQIADSACTATAYLCGVKANQGTIGLTAAVERGDCTASAAPGVRLASLAAWALQAGRAVGVVSTARVTHASPAGAYAHVAERNWESDADVRASGLDPAHCPDIAHQLVHQWPALDFKVILGGGRREFLPNGTVDEEGTAGKRLDGRNLIEEWLADKMARNVSRSYVWNKAQLDSLQREGEMPEYLLGLFEGSHMQYNAERDAEAEPSLAEMTEAAIRMLSKSERGFFLFVEGGRIDHAHHENRAALALDETVELSAAVASAAALLDDSDSLLVVTADHAHVMAFNGYTRRGSDVLGPSDSLGDDGVPYMTLSYANGPGYRAASAAGRVDVTKDEDFGSLQWLSPAGVPLASETHGGDDVAVFARGPHHAVFSGLYEQNAIPHLMAYAACIGPGRRACDRP